MSKSDVLNAVKKNKPESLPLPEIPMFSDPEVNLLEKFRAVAEGSGSKVLEIWREGDLKAYLEKEGSSQEKLFSAIEGVESSLPNTSITDPLELHGLDLAIIGGQLGVAENGAIWVSEKNMGHRVLPFIAENLMIVLYEKDMVLNMHEAYSKIDVAEDGFGVFIAGPSKTADIEQSLVIGAQGARSLTIIIMKD